MTAFISGAASVALAVMVIGAARAEDAFDPASVRIEPLTARVLDLVAKVEPVQATVRGTLADGSDLDRAIEDLANREDGISVRRVGGTTRVVLTGDVLFAFDRADILPNAEPILDSLARVLATLDEGPVVVEGHTDAKGSDDYNLQLSQRRADAVVAWLVGERALDRVLFQPLGRGEKDPVAPNAKPDGSDDADGRARNRRVEFVLP